MSISWKRIAGALAIVAGGVGLFFLSTFSFLAMRGKLDMETLTRLPMVGGLFESDAVRAQRAERTAFDDRLRRIERSIEQLAALSWTPEERATRASLIRREEDGSVIFEVEPVTVSLQGSGSKRFLTSRFTLGIETDDEYGEDDPLDLLSKAQSRAVIRDAVIRICREKTVQEIEEDFELEGLKKEIAQAVQNSVFGKRPGRVKQVYLDEFLIQ